MALRPQAKILILRLIGGLKIRRNKRVVLEDQRRTDLSPSPKRDEEDKKNYTSTTYHRAFAVQVSCRKSVDNGVPPLSRLLSILWSLAKAGRFMTAFEP